MLYLASCGWKSYPYEALGYFDQRPWHQERPLYPKAHGPETLRNYWGYGSERVIKGYQTNEIPTYGAIES